MMSSSSLLRPAIAMIELIFALMIMGIAIMSAPMLIATSIQSTDVALYQEGINEAASRAAMVMTYQWDENDVNDSCVPPVLVVANGDSLLDEVNTPTNPNTGRRIGVPKETKSRTFLCENKRLNASDTLGSESGETSKDDLDDFNANTTLVNIDSASVDYLKKTVTITTTISYISDAPSSGGYGSAQFSYVPGTTSAQSTNIKQITVTVTSNTGESELDQTITLDAFSCNIGGYKYEERTL